MDLYRRNFPKKLLDEIRRRPGMYIWPAESFFSLMNFIRGFSVGCHVMAEAHSLTAPNQSIALKLEDNFLGFFSLWCQRKYNIGSSMLGYWTASLWRGGNDDKKSFHSFFEIMDEFESELQEQGEGDGIADLLRWQKAQAEEWGHWDF